MQLEKETLIFNPYALTLRFAGIDAAIATKVAKAGDELTGDFVFTNEDIDDTVTLSYEEMSNIIHDYTVDNVENNLLVTYTETTSTIPSIKWVNDHNSAHLFATSLDAVNVNANTITARSKLASAAVYADAGHFNSVNVYNGDVKILRGRDLLLQAEYGSSDPGDIVFTNINGDEIGRIWGGSSINFRLNGTDGTIANLSNSGLVVSKGGITVANGDVVASNGYFSNSVFLRTNYDVSAENNGLESGVGYPTTFNILDKDGRIMTRLEGVINSTGTISGYWYVRNYNTSGTLVAQKGIQMTMDKEGTLTYSVSDPAKFRSAIGAVNIAGDTMTGSLHFSKDSPLIFNYTAGAETPMLVLNNAANYGIRYTEGTPDKMKFSASGNANSDAADLCINGAGDGTVTIRGNTILHAGNYTSYTLRYINTTDVTTWTADTLAATDSIAFTRGNVTGAHTTGHIVWLNVNTIGTPFQLVVHDSSEMYFYKRYKSSGTWTSWAKMNAGYADSAGYTNLLQNKGGSTVTTSSGLWNHGKTKTVDVWYQRWTQSGLTYTPSGGSATTLTDSGDMVIFLSQSTTSNVLMANLVMDGSIYANNGFVGNVTGHASSDLALSGGTMTGDILFANSGTTTRQIRGIVGDNDYWRIAGGATASNGGWMEIATADDGNEPIYVRQYTGAYTTVTRTLTLLDASGNTTFPGTIVSNGDILLQNGRNLILRAPSSSTNDPGDVIFQNSSGTEIGRLFSNGSSLYLRFNGDKNILYCNNSSVTINSNTSISGTLTTSSLATVNNLTSRGHMTLMNASLTKGTAPSAETNRAIAFTDKDGWANTNTDLIGVIYGGVTASNMSYMIFRVLKAADTSSNNFRQILIQYPASGDPLCNISMNTSITGTLTVSSTTTISGSLHLANNTWNNIGDDVRIGDANVAGRLCVQGLNSTTGIRLYKYGDTATYADIHWDGWLRLGETAANISGIYFGSRLVRTDGTLRSGTGSTNWTDINPGYLTARKDSGEAYVMASNGTNRLYMTSNSNGSRGIYAVRADGTGHWMFHFGNNSSTGTFYGNCTGNANYATSAGSASSASSASYATSAGSANSVAWGNVTSKPSTFSPSSHGHSSFSNSLDMSRSSAGNIHCTVKNPSIGVGLVADNDCGVRGYYGSSNKWLISMTSAGAVSCNGSDRRLKFDYGYTTEEETLSILQNVRIHNFTYKNDTKNILQNGIIAQELRDVLISKNIGTRPYLIMESTNPDDTSVYYDLNMPEEDVIYSVDYSKFTPLLWHGWQIHDTRLDKHEDRITALEQENKELKLQIEELQNKLMQTA